ncbi:HNH endonuclease [Tunturiibacter psychrotolerans]|uniref:HNH endonuclease n=1 Tax=Tunturiibacter psychrotolerans TaxID=3069686 RepID=UPI003D1A6108
MQPYLECHHIVWLARGGDDTIENTVAMCPNCHRRMHVLDDRRKLTELAKLRWTDELARNLALVELA